MLKQNATRFYLILGVAVILSGCERAYYLAEAPELEPLTSEEFKALSAEDQAGYTETSVVSESTAERVNWVSKILSAAMPLVPPPYGELGLIALLGATTLWQRHGKTKVRGRLDRVELGARITADTVERVVRPALTHWEEFKSEQDNKKAHTDAIMPDEL